MGFASILPADPSFAATRSIVSSASVDTSEQPLNLKYLSRPFLAASYLFARLVAIG
ncbi:MAG: hypothetical protein IPG58_16490 [Acidobacteria bacterium]|nr:hypothetical protein [Acidobacteriota bacterium]